MSHNSPPRHLKLVSSRHGDATQHIFPGHDNAEERRECWIRTKKLGEGGYGAVWQEQCIEGTGRTYQQLRAVKVTRRRNEKAWRRELNAMFRFSQYTDYFVQLQGWFEDETSFSIAMEYIPHGTLQDHVREKALPESEAMVVFMQLAQALQYMHQDDFLHRDLKLLNILVAKPAPEWHVKIADFGVSKDMNSNGATTGDVGTLSFMAPEILLQREDKYTKAGDIWSLGVVTYCLLARNAPFKHFLELTDYGKGSALFPVQPLERKRCSALAVRLIEAMMAPRRDDRPRIEQIVKDRWLATEDSSEDDGDDPYVASKGWSDTWSHGQQDSGVAVPRPIELSWQAKRLSLGDDTILPVANQDALLLTTTPSGATLPLRQKALTTPSDEVGSKDSVGVTTRTRRKPLPQRSQDEIDAILNQAAKDRRLHEAGPDAILVAAHQGWISELGQEIAKQGTDHSDRDGLTALHHAVLGGSIEAVDILLCQGANVDAPCPSYGTALCIAALKGEAETVQLLIDFKANVKASGGQLGSALHAAAASSSIDVAITLIQHGAAVNVSRTVCLNLIQNLTGRLRIDQRANPFQYRECEPLLLAVRSGNLDMVQFLIKAGSDVNVKHRRWEAGRISVAYSDDEAKFKTEDDTALLVAAGWDHADIVEFLLSTGVNINDKNKQGATAVIYAAEWDSIRSLEVLVKAGASLHFRDSDGYNCLQLAALEGRPKALNMLLDHGMDVNEKDEREYTALTSAAIKGHTECVKILCARRALVDNRTDKAITALHFAVEGNHLEVIRILLDSGASIDLQTNDGETPLMVAAYRRHLDAAKLLVNHGAKLSLTDNKGLTALQIAEDTSENDEMVAFLLKARPVSRPKVVRSDEAGDKAAASGKKGLRFWRK